MVSTCFAAVLACDLCCVFRLVVYGFDLVLFMLLVLVVVSGLLFGVGMLGVVICVALINSVVISFSLV